MRRAKHTLSHYRMVTANMGELIPIACVPVLPGDTFQHSTSVLVRVSPLNTPVMHPVRIRVHHWFVPNRILWPESEGGGWESFITGGKDGVDQQTIPQVNSVSDSVKRVTEYLGAPKSGQTYQINALPVRGFWRIYNTRYRDQDLVAEVSESEAGPLPVVAWEKDYLTTARPWSQKGPAVTLPLGTSAPVTVTGGSQGVAPGVLGQTSQSLHALDSTGATTLLGPSGLPSGSEMFADLANAKAPSVNDFRAAFSIQRYQEARARYGSRFTEYLRYLGITPSDARLQEPEYLGGGTARLNFSEVLQTTPAAQAGQAGVGDLYGHGIAGVRSNAYRKFFEEHGYVYTLMSVRPKSIYQNGIDREFLKRTKEDYFQRELANLGQQEVYASEAFANAANHDRVFGYQDRYDEYRGCRSSVSQDFRDTLNSWHLARELTDNVTLNNSFVNCVPSKRIYQVTTADPLWIMANHHIVARRMVPKRANPRII